MAAVATSKVFGAAAAAGFFGMSSMVLCRELKEPAAPAPTQQVAGYKRGLGFAVRQSWDTYRTTSQRIPEDTLSGKSLEIARVMEKLQCN